MHVKISIAVGLTAALLILTLPAGAVLYFFYAYDLLTDRSDDFGFCGDLLSAPYIFVCNWGGAAGLIGFGLQAWRRSLGHISKQDLWRSGLFFGLSMASLLGFGWVFLHDAMPQSNFWPSWWMGPLRFLFET